MLKPTTSALLKAKRTKGSRVFYNSLSKPKTAYHTGNAFSVNTYMQAKMAMNKTRVAD